MAITHNEIQVTWSAANSKTLAYGATDNSDEITFDATAVSGMITCKADNAGTPASGDTVDFYIKYSCGDPDGASSDEYDTDGHAALLCRIDTNIEDEAIKTVPILTDAKKAKIYIVSNAASNSIVCSCCITEVRA